MIQVEAKYTQLVRSFINENEVHSRRVVLLRGKMLAELTLSNLRLEVKGE